MAEIPPGMQFVYRSSRGESIDSSELGEGMAKLLTKISAMQPDVVVFLDKSGRRYAGIYGALRKEKFGDFPLDSIKFLNIGREFPGGAELKVNYIIEDAKKQGTLTHTFAKHVKDKKVLVVDDTVSRGSTQGQVERVFSEAFQPSAFEFISLLRTASPESNLAGIGVVENAIMIGNVPVSLPFTVGYKRYLRKLPIDTALAEEQQRLSQLTQKARRQHKPLPSQERVLELMSQRDELGLFPDISLRSPRAITDVSLLYSARRALRQQWVETAKRIAPNIHPQAT